MAAAQPVKDVVCEGIVITVLVGELRQPPMHVIDIAQGLAQGVHTAQGQAVGSQFPTRDMAGCVGVLDQPALCVVPEAFLRPIGVLHVQQAAVSVMAVARALAQRVDGLGQLAPAVIAQFAAAA